MISRLEAGSQVSRSVIPQIGSDMSITDSQLLVNEVKDTVSELPVIKFPKLKQTSKPLRILRSRIIREKVEE